MQQLMLLGLACLLLGKNLCGEEVPTKTVPRIEISDPLPYGQKPIDYFGSETANPVEKLRDRLRTGDVKLVADSAWGYLASLLEELDISATSQVLVFSKTALNPKLVSPETPRAVYFNEETYVGWVPGSAALEIATVDPIKGWMFYTLTQPEFSNSDESGKPPLLKRENQCLACHAGQSTLRVPGGLVRAFVPDAKGNPLSGYSRVTHEMPFEKRFGGWYVTGEHGQQTHRGNIVESQTGPPPELMKSPNNLKDLEGVLDSSRYLSAHSDLVAQLLLHHQVHGQNLLIRVGYEARFGKRSDAEEQFVRYVLFAEEAPLSEAVRGSTKFAEWFQKRGKADSAGRSLRDWDLKTRLFKHRLSYLIDSPLFDHLPADAKNRIDRNLRELLTAANPPEPYNRIPAEERRAIWELLGELRKDLPAEFGASNRKRRGSEEPRQSAER